MNKNILDQFFNQPPASNECGARCVWLLLAFKNKIDLGYNQFLNGIWWLTANGSGLYNVDLFRILKYMGVCYNITFPSSKKGLYLIWFSTSSIMGHFCVYYDGFLYDPCDTEPRKVGLDMLKSRISSKVNPDYDHYIGFAEIS